MPEPPAWPDAPEAPEAPDAPDADGSIVYMDVDDNGRAIERRIVLKPDPDGEGGRKITMRKVDKDGKVTLEERIVPTFSFVDEKGRKVSEAEFERHLEKAMQLKQKEFEEMGERIEREMKIRFGDGAAARMMQLGCDGEEGASSAIATAEGAFAMALCAEGFARQAQAVAVQSLNAARKAVEVDRNLTDEQCAEALKAIDDEIKRLTIES
jgi:hypothetical protein